MVDQIRLVSSLLYRFLSCAKPATMAGALSKNFCGDGQVAGGRRSEKNLPVYGNQQKSRVFENMGAMLGSNVIHEDTTVNVSVINDRHTWVFNFKLTPANLALRICKHKGGRCVVSCLDNKALSWPNVLSGGPVLFKPTSGHAEAVVASASPKGKGKLDQPNPTLLSVENTFCVYEGVRRVLERQWTTSKW